MYAGIDSVGPDQPMERNHNLSAGLFYVAIQLVMHFFMFAILEGVILDNYTQMKAVNHVRAEGDYFDSFPS